MNKLVTGLLLKSKPRERGNGSVHYLDLMEAYRKAFRMSTWGYVVALITGVFKFENEWYKEVDEELIRLVLDADHGDKEEWVLDYYDCGGFTFNLMGVFHQNGETAAMPIFITWVDTPTGGHAVLSFDDGISVRIIEPQSDEIYSIPNSWKPMLICG